MSNILISLAAEFTGKKAFKQADTATQRLNSSVKKLAGSIGLAYGTTAVIAFGKASVKAAAGDQKAQQQLALALKNVGLGRDAANSEAYIQRLQTEFGIVDDLLRPAYQTLAVATRDSAEAQRLLNLSLDIAASTGKDLGTVTSALSKAYLGNNTALSKLGVGISKADLKAKSFEDITKQLTATFAGSATAAANTFQGSIDKLGVASANVQEIIGTGLIDALTNLGEDTSIADLASNMEATATYLADVIRGVGILAGKLKDIPVLGNLNVGMIPIVGSYIELLRKAGTQTGTLTSADNAHLKSLQDSFKVIKKTGAITTKLTKDELAKLKAKQLQAAIDKANLALGKGSNIFDMDAIQLNAAMINQAEQLGKATSAAQVLAITNDIQRLKVKQDILDLEKAIASGDIAAIEAATAKLNKDTEILGQLNGQKATVQTIADILKGIQPKALIDIANLNLAISLLNQINGMPKSGASGASGATAGAPAPSIVGLSPATTIASLNENVASLGGVISVIADNGTEFIKLVDGLAPVFQAIEDVGTFNALVNSFAGGNIGSFGAGSARIGEGGSLFNSGAVGSRDINISVTTGIGDPNAIAEAVTQVIQDAVDRGTLRSERFQ
jgi:hypothetical protein